MATLSDTARALVDGKNVATVATVEPDGSVQQSVVWVTRDGDDVLFSTLAGRRKHSNLQRDPRISLLITPADNPYQYLAVRGTATLTTDNGSELITELGVKYTGKPYDADQPGDVRVTVRVTPEHVTERL
jgi:PPOX class probable F420-dependent enzyme